MDKTMRDAMSEASRRAYRTGLPEDRRKPESTLTIIIGEPSHEGMMEEEEDEEDALTE